MEEMGMEPSQLCREFARILNSTPSVVNGVCTATRFRNNIHPVVLGRRAEAFPFIPQAFSFESMDRNGRALCLGETVLLQEEVNPFMTELREFGIIVTAVHNHWLFDKPRLMFMHFESIDEPLTFARKVREAMKVLIKRTVRAEAKVDGEMIKQHGLCDEFNDILGGTMHTFENGICTVMRSRTNIKPEVLGRPGRSFLLIPQMFSFESMTKDGRALCSGETVILQKEINPFISVLREHDLIVTSLHNHWLFDKPRLMYIHFESIDKPINFALKVRDALKVLTDKEVRG
ncbi:MULTISPECIES: DUF1259 domain-containing protein [Bacillus]|uniref:DUF1259 domain-containing protein n=1 Tax=Bacillus TaxID=1386 RepID=UPI000425186D|nr:MULTISPECIES: DUF1259 domain-containing protein [Bacillus]MBU8676231.1 DUF1259 domain-containing protein [Bacillus subtilis]MBU8804380.1 DUF1259 domain-containing protein [Bacillus subtilis]MCL6427962.1 DUF1259 domain-containing protein [Bacillus subtilis]MED3386186.1 DUF1259 domain-containing protein [Bacillus subtilis]MED3488237.1 DUF1259 domain-containing protein [Bacillus subtilis]